MTDKQLIKVVAGFRRGLLAGRDSDFMCFAVSAPLQAYLKFEHGIETRLVSGECRVETKPGRFVDAEHFWLQLKDGRILDPTHDQFGYSPRVYLGPLPTNFKELEAISEKA